MLLQNNILPKNQKKKRKMMVKTKRNHFMKKMLKL